MVQSHIARRASVARQVEDIRAAPGGGLFPLTPALSLGERVNHSLRGEQSRSYGFPLRAARYSLSLGERVRVRGNGANCSTPYEDESHPSEIETRRARRRHLADPA